MEPGFSLRVVGLVAVLTAMALATCSGAFAWNAQGPSGTTLVHVPDNAIPSAMCPTFSQETPGVPGCGHLQFTFFQSGTLTVTVTLDCSSLPDPTTCFAQDINPAVCLEHAPTLGSVTGNCPASSAAPNDQGLEAQTATTTSGQVSNCTDPAPDPMNPANADGSTNYVISCDVIPGSYELVISGFPLNTCDPNALDFAACSIAMAGPGANAIVSWQFSNGAFQIGTGDLRIHGAGQVLDNSQEFSSHAEQSRPDYTHNRFRRHVKGNSCSFWNDDDSPSSVTITRNPITGGGDATITGKGWVKKDGSSSKVPVSYTAVLHDSGQKTNGDTYSLSNGGLCDTGGVAQPVVRGDIDVDLKRERKDH
jgi:hypothetical protein